MQIYDAPATKLSSLSSCPVSLSPSEANFKAGVSSDGATDF
jgi:hypothetical protein